MAAKKELTVAEKLKGIYQLQLVDAQLDQIKVLKGELPMEVADLEDEIAGLETRINKLTQDVDDLGGQVAKHESNILEAKALIEKYERQLNNVKNNREYDALTKEVELQRLEIQLSEKRIKEAAGNVEAKEATLANAQERLVSKNKELVDKKTELEKILEKTEKDEEKLIRKIERTRKKIDARLIKSYDRIRASYRNGLGVVKIERNSCGGCFNKIPPQIQLEVSQRKKVLACEHCSRVLVDDNILDVNKAPKVPKGEAAAEKAK